jgi:Flp pilus assembly protein TadB
MESLLPGTWVRSLSRKLAQAGWSISAGKYADYSAGISFAAVFVAYALDPSAAAFALAVPALALSLPDFLARQRASAIERTLPDALYRASSVAGFSPFEEVLASLARGKSPLAREFYRVRSDVSLGRPAEDALRAAARRNDSRAFGRVCGLLATGYSLGADMAAALREAADDISETAAMVRERAAGLAIEKWTLLLAGGAVVPFTLGTMASLTGSLELGGLSDFGVGLGVEQKAELRSAAVLGNEIYLAAYSILAAVFVAHLEGRMERALPYAMGLVPMSSIIFDMAKSGALGLF